jgi:hypothetical protein
MIEASGGRDAALVPQPGRDVTLYRAAEEIVLYSTRRELAIALNLSASAVWELCDGTRTLDEIANELATLVGGDVRALRADVERVVLELQALELLVPAERRAA